jgi:hydrogenase maturation protein HypF
VELWDPAGTRLEHGDAALQAAERLIRDGGIVAAKGIGGFHLVVDARNEHAVRRLREQKHREEKPFALMFPAVAMVRTVCEVSEREERLLCSPETPIVLLSRRERTDGETAAWTLAASVAPHNPYLGIMLPYAPLHHILLHDLGFPVVATSGNLSDEPMCTDEREALTRLAGIADAFLVHNRPITRPIDDAIARVVMGREMILRRARGYAPLPVTITHTVPDMLAVGAHLKSTVAVARGDQVFISQHLGDLETEQSLRAFNHETEALQQLYEIVPERVVSDLHPDYLSSAYARKTGYPHDTVQHHYAHIASCMADNGLDGRVLGVAWDGTGYGLDGTIWGGEFLLTDGRGFRRVATLRSFRLPGGEAAVKEPRRSALGVLYELFGTSLQERTDLVPVQMFDAASRQLLLAMLTRNVNAPLTTSVGRLFDAVASLAGVRQISTYEGQAAMELEFAVAGNTRSEAYPWRIVESNGDSDPSFLTVDWEPLVDSILRDRRSGCQSGVIATRFHNALAGIIVDVARRIGEPRVALSGGCFQNKYLTECTVRLLEEAGFSVYWHQRVPPNDGGIALGQIYAVARSRSQ